MIGESGTGCGVGLAWLASAVPPETVLVSVERDPSRAEVAREVFAGTGNVTVLTGDWRVLADHGPFDLLVLDGGGTGKEGEPAADPELLLAPGARWYWTTSRRPRRGHRCSPAAPTAAGSTG